MGCKHDPGCQIWPEICDLLIFKEKPLFVGEANSMRQIPLSAPSLLDLTHSSTNSPQHDVFDSCFLYVLSALRLLCFHV